MISESETIPSVRIEPLTGPYEPAIAALLSAMMPAGVEPIGLFRAFAKNPGLTRAMQAWGHRELSRELSVSLRQREIVIDRTCVRCGCEYEWGVHVAFFAERAGFTPAQITSLTWGQHDDPCWEVTSEQLLIQLVDALHDHSDIDNQLWTALALQFDQSQLLDLLMLCGWYHAISFTARAGRIAREPWTPTFASVR
jgi:alkylhydroperoxidase family enzyme